MRMGKSIRITVVTIVRNDVRHISATIDSIASQSARNQIEYIVVDGASTDGTIDVIRGRRTDIDIFISEPDTGIYNAMNKGLDAASGDYIIFMNCGDRFSATDTVETVIKSINEHASLPAMVYGNYRETDGNMFSKPIPCRDSKYIWYGPVASHQSIFYNLTSLRNYALKYDESYRIAADYKLTLEILVYSKHDALKLSVCISDFDICGISNTNQNKGLHEANRARREVLHWNRLRTASLTVLLFSARYLKRFGRPFYNLLRL